MFFGCSSANSFIKSTPWSFKRRGTFYKEWNTKNIFCTALTLYFARYMRSKSISSNIVWETLIKSYLCIIPELRMQFPKLEKCEELTSSIQKWKVNRVVISVIMIDGLRTLENANNHIKIESRSKCYLNLLSRAQKTNILRKFTYLFLKCFKFHY